MDAIRDLSQLEALYGAASSASLEKVADHLTEQYATWIARSRFCIVSTVGPGGVDSSPRGDTGSVAEALDAQTLAIPDWRGNNRLDTLRNIVSDGRVSLLFMVPGSNIVVRVNGTAILTEDADLRARFANGKATPKTVIVVNVGEIYFQCARALLRSQLWSGEDQSEGLPTEGQILGTMTAGAIDGVAYDTALPERAAKTLWSD